MTGYRGSRSRKKRAAPAARPGAASPSPTHDLEADLVEKGAEPRAGEAFPVVGVGASAGGLEAFTQLLKALPADTGMAFVLVQHLAPTHASALAEILSRATTMPVAEVHDETAVEPNHVYVIPPGQDMIISGGALQLRPRRGRGAHRPVDQFLRALAEERRHRSIGVVLSGTATDGTIGLEAIKAEGGITFAQDATAQHEGMPHSAIASGCVDFVLPPEEIAREIVRIGRHPYAVPEAEASPPIDERNLAQVLQLLHRAGGVDFSHYKFNTLYRRVTRRMVLQKKDDLSDYVGFLRQSPAEIEALYHDILISVTRFFRDPEAFEALRDRVFPRLIEGRGRHDTVRIWSVGCSTGQEAYSLAMAFVEFAEGQGSPVPLQVFATDLDEKGVDTARAGIYPKEIAEDVSPERLRRFFVEVDGRYRISKEIRDVCVFSRHNVLADPPFSRIDLISCRNLLIYLEPVLQQKIVPTLHYALKPAGFLWLGGSETIGSYRSLFEAEDARHKIYAKKPGPHVARFPLQRGGAPRPSFTGVAPGPLGPGTELHREADRVLVSRFAPPSVLVSADLEILQYRGETGAYLAPSPGKASLNLLKMLREGLLVGVRAAIVRAGKEQAPARETGLRVKSDGGYREVAVEVVPVRGSGATDEAGKGGGFLVLFEEASGGHGPQPASVASAPPPPAADRAAARLEQELGATREYLQSVIEQQEAANEELQSANEEVQSANEELQSVNEELETSKEEIQSSNEELATVNDELNNRNAELGRLNNDLVNLLGSVQVPIVMLGPDLRIRRFTPAAEKLLGLGPRDLGRPIGAVELAFELPGLEPLLAEVMDTVRNQERDVQDEAGRWYSLRLRPYRTLENKIDGVVLMLVDVDLLKSAQEYTESIVATLREPHVVLDADLRVRTANRSFYRHFQVRPEDTEGRLLHELGGGQWNIPELRRLLGEVLPHDRPLDDFEVAQEFEHIGKRSMLLSARRLLQLGDRTPSILLAMDDVTERRRSEESLRRHADQFQTLLYEAPFGVFVVDADFRIRHVNPTSFTVFGDLEVIGRDFDDVTHVLWPKAYADEIVERFRHTLETGEPYTAPERTEERLDRDVTETYEWQVSRIPLPDGRNGVVCYFRDISARVLADRRLAESEERLRLSQEVAKVGSFDWDIQTGGIIWTPALEAIYGLAPGEFARTQPAWEELLHPEDRPAALAAVAHALATGEDVESEWRVVWKDGSVHWVAGRFRGFKNAAGQPVRLAGVNIDVTERKRTEEALQQADRRKNEFLALLAHELRNPLAPIRNALEIMRLRGGDTETVQLASRMMERQVGQMVRLVDDLLDVSRVSRGKIELRKGPLELASAVNEAADAARGLYESMELELTVTLPPQPVYLNADPTRMAQVVGNLLSNASKFTGKGGRVELTVEREAKHAVIKVRDSGIGIAAAQLSRIFDMFVQVDTSLERPVAGLGIGLTLVKTLVELHGGTVEARSAGLGHGSEFVVRLPVLAGPPSTSPPPLAPTISEPAPPTPRRILVVDDNRDSAESMAMLLALSGHETQRAFDGVEAIETAAATRPDVVLLDIGLPRLNGYEAARRIRAQPWGASMVLVALTGWGQQEDRQKSREAGFDGHLVKPVDPASLAKLLAELPGAGNVPESASHHGG